MSNVSQEQLEKIMEGVDILQNFKIEFALLKEKSKQMEQKIKEETEERKDEIKSLKTNYVERFNSLDLQTKKNRSKIGDVAVRLEKKISHLESQISGLYMSLSDFIKKKIVDIKSEILIEVDMKIKDETHEISKTIIKVMWIILSIVITGFVSFWVKEFVNYIGWVKP